MMFVNENSKTKMLMMEIKKLIRLNIARQSIRGVLIKKILQLEVNRSIRINNCDKKQLYITVILLKKKVYSKLV